MSTLQKNDAPLNEAQAPQDAGRRETLRFIGCLLCAAAVPGVLAGAQAQALSVPVKVLTASDTLASGDFKLFSLAGDPVILYAGAGQEAGSLKWGSVWLVAYSRICSHRSTVMIDPPQGQTMTCPRHHQAYDLSTGQPTGYRQVTSDPLAQYGLQLKADRSVWITGLIRPQAG